MVMTRGPVTDANLAQLRLHSVVHGVIQPFNIVAVTPKGLRGRIAISRLSFVARVETDSLRYLTSVGTWDRDILDVEDVEETGTVGDPDAREVSQTGAGVLDPFIMGSVINPSWDTACGGKTCDPVGAGLVQVDTALAATP